MKRMQHSWGRYAVRVLAASVAALLLAGCASADGKREVRRESFPYWEKGAGASQAVKFMRVQVPKGAVEVKGAVRVQPQERVYLLSFLTDEKAAEAVADDLRPEHPLEAKNFSSSLSDDGFAHLDLDLPHEIPDVRSTSVCPPCVGDKRRSHIQGIEMHIEDRADGRARVYLTAY
ncbi:hypothetical protein GCM10010232_40500 [Streptomyces amakusaensis]|uniref:Lipoprotein n=1 Tax=Streptomyces amakusaensis TaxID=67271 RepID=A0ABW0AJ16_9ACTN